MRTTDTHLSRAASADYACEQCKHVDHLWRFVRFWTNRAGLERRDCQCKACGHSWHQIIIL